MEDQRKILIGVFGGLIGVGVIIGLSILRWRKKEKNRRDKEDARWRKFQKDNTLFKSKVLGVKEQLDGIWVTVGELETSNDKRDLRDQEHDKILNELQADLNERKEEAEEAERFETEALEKILHELIAPMHKKLDENDKKLDRNDKRIDKLNEDLKLLDQNVTQANKDFQFAGKAFKALREMNKEDKKNENDPEVKRAIILAQLEELRGLRNELVDIDKRQRSKSEGDIVYNNSENVSRRLSLDLNAKNTLLEKNS